MEEMLISEETIDLNHNLHANTSVLFEELREYIKPGAAYSTIDMNVIFGRDIPVNIEIGIGNGEFICHYAELRRDEGFIGFEIYKKGIVSAHNRVIKKKLDNVRLINYDGEFFTNMLRDNSISNFYVNFPDPWPKRKHNKRRLLKTEFLKTVCGKLKLNGKLYIATDFGDYAEEIVRNIIPVDKLQSDFDTYYIKELLDYYPTKYYRKFVGKNGLHFFKYTKVSL